jgi:hypothetical protein
MSCQMSLGSSEKGALSGERRNDEKPSSVRICAGGTDAVVVAGVDGGGAEVGGASAAAGGSDDVVS